MPADFTVQVRGMGAVKALYARLRGQLPYAQMIALNRTAEDILTELRAQVRRAFIVRSPGFILPPQRLPREWQARKTQLTARVNLGEGGQKKLGERRRAILEPFEEGRPKTFNQFGPVAIPTSYIRPDRGNLIDPKLYPRFLLGRYNSLGELQGLGRTARIASRTQRKLGTKKGQQVGRYFVLGNSGDPYWGVYERQSPTQLRRLWTYRPLVRRPPSLAFDRTSYDVFDRRWEANFNGAIEVALRTAR